MTYQSSQKRPTSIEVLEPRFVLSATPLSVIRALDLPDGTPISLDGDSAEFATLTLGATGQLLGFPSGGDGDFLILSTGIASHVTSIGNTSSNQGTDLGAPGEAGDTAAVSFTLPVPVGGEQRLKIDFMFLTEEYPEYVHAGFNDTFTININGTNYAKDENGNIVTVDNAYFTGEPAPGTFFDGRTNKLTLTYVVPDGVTSLNIEMRISDVGDGVLDSAVLVDNVRFETPQVVYLDFDGATIANHFGPGISGTLPAFTAADIGSSDTVENLVAALVAKLQSKYSLYDVQFTTSQPLGGDFTTLYIGGDNGILLDISGASPLLKKSFPGASIPLRDLFGLGADSLLGLAGSPDVGNLDRNDLAVIFSGEFDDFFSNITPEERLDQLAITLAHELGHNLGLRHLSDTAVGDIMKHTAPRDSGAVFGNTLISLDEQWSDGATDQNDSAYLSSILGKSSGTGLSQTLVASTGYFAPKVPHTLYNVTLSISSNDPGSAPLIFHFDKLNGTQNIPLPTLSSGAVFSLSAASKLGGTIDVFSGPITAGQLSAANSDVPLFDANGNLRTIPLAREVSGHFVSYGMMPLIANDLGDVSVMPGKVRTFTDADGDKYTVRLTGPGLIGFVLDDPDQNGRGGLTRISLDDTNSETSILSVTVQRGAHGDGRVNIGAITGALGAGLKSLTAPAANITGGGVVFSGILGSVNVRDLVDGADLLSGAGEGVKTSVRVRNIGDGSDLSIGTELSLFKAARFGNSTLAAPSLDSLLVSGEFAAQLNIAGLLTAFSSGDVLGTAHVTAGGASFFPTTLAMRVVNDGATFAVASAITTLKATRIGDASFSAERFDSVKVAGDVGGDFTADDKIVLFSARDLLGTASIIAEGAATDSAALTFHEVKSGAEINLGSSITLFKAAKVGAATLQAASITSLSIKGDARIGIAGDFDASLTLSGGDASFNNVLTSAYIAGGVHGANIVSDCIGSFSARSISDSTIFVGYTPADAMNPLDGGVFFDGSKINSFTIRSGQSAFSNTFIAAKTIGTISVASLVSDNGGTPFGFPADVAPTKVVIPGFVYQKTGPADQSLGDFHVKVV